jgi:hypothetical protein
VGEAGLPGSGPHLRVRAALPLEIGHNGDGSEWIEPIKIEHIICCPPPGTA